MKMIKTLILDDDPTSRQAAREALSHFDDISIEDEFSSSDELMSFLDRQEADLLFLDIELDAETGFEIAEKLRETRPELMLVFLTGHSSYAIDGYDFQPVNFLTKPINGEKLAHTVEEVRARLNKNRTVQSEAKIMFRLPKGYRIMNVRDICYIERVNRRNVMYLPDERIRIAGYSMNQIEAILAPHGFFMCHQSFIISLYRVESVRDIRRQLYEVKLRDVERPLPVSRNKYELLMKGLSDIQDKIM